METEKTDNGTLEHWTPAEVAEAFAREEIVLIDVRTPQEFNFERIDGALLSPMQVLRPQHLPTQNDKRIVFHCGSGVRSARVAKLYLSDSNADLIAHMKGGFGAWKADGLGYTATDPTTGGPKAVPSRS